MRKAERNLGSRAQNAGWIRSLTFILSLSGELCVTNAERLSVRGDSSLQQLSLRMTREAARFLSHPEHSEGSRASSALRSIADIWVTQSSPDWRDVELGMRIISLACTADRPVFRFLRGALLERAGYEPPPRSRARTCDADRMRVWQF